MENQTGKLFCFLFFLIQTIYSFGQCRSIGDLVSVFDGDYSLSEYAISSQNSSSFSTKGYDFNIQGQEYYFSNNDKLIFSSNQYCILSTNSNCYGIIKAEVAKQQGAKVSSKTISTSNNYEIEQYRHLSRDIIFEFQKNSQLGKYIVVLMSAETSILIDNSIISLENRKRNENIIREKLVEIRSSISNEKFNKAESLTISAKKLAIENNLEHLFISDFDAIEKQISLGKYSAFKLMYDNYLNARYFIKAKELLKQYSASSNNNNSNEVQQLQIDLTKKAVDFYGSKISEKKLSKNYSEAIIYADSLLIFEPNNKQVKSDKSELISINSYLLERKTKVYDYWELHKEAKSNITNDFRDLSLSSITKKNGSLSFDISINSDTSCNLIYNLSWKTPPSSKIIFSEIEKNKYALTPYQKFDVCGKSEGKISFDLSWTSTNNSVKFVGKSFRGSNSINSNVQSFISTKYPQSNGRYKYVESNVNMNGNKIDNIQLTGFHTRGPQNAIFSLILPGAGSLIVSYGKKGIAPMALFGAGVAAYFLTDDSLINLAGIATIATAYLWDFTSTIVIGSKNIARSKTVRKSLHNGPILM